MAARRIPTVTGWIQDRANALLADDLAHPAVAAARRRWRSPPRIEHDFLGAYTADLANIIDFAAIRAAGIRIGVDPLGGAGVHYWARIARASASTSTVISSEVDPQFGFMTLDWDGRIRWICRRRTRCSGSSRCKDRFRRGVRVRHRPRSPRHRAPGAGLMPSNHYLSVAIDYLFRNRPAWSADAAVGKTVVSRP